VYNNKAEVFRTNSQKTDLVSNETPFISTGDNELWAKKLYLQALAGQLSAKWAEAWAAQLS